MTARRKAKIYSAFVKGTPTLLKAFVKANAVKRFKELDSSVKSSSVKLMKFAVNSHQAPVDQ